MGAQNYTCPLSRRDVIDRYFMEHRAKLIDLAAFLDRIDRAAPASGDAEDFRITALKDAAKILNDGRGERAKRVLELFSDPTAEPIPAAGTKGATGVYPAYKSGV